MTDIDGYRELLDTNGAGKFWKFDSISEDQFKEMADTGDILLFRGR